ncbi:hypothetical protein C1645_707710, partial [Glomus cerebriforme]
MFQKFYDNESINCLLFLKYIERISFYELKVGESEPKLLYTIQLDNADQVRKQRRLIVENIVSLMDSLKSKNLAENNQLQASYVASFSRQKENNKKNKEISSWLILNYLDDLNEAEAHFRDKFNKNIGDYKFVPNVGLAVPLDNSNDYGRLFCFLPLPISMPFRVSVHGYFAVSTNRRSIWSAADNEDLAADALARLKVMWNRYLFENVLPKAWVKFLCELPLKVPNIQLNDLYNKFWPIVKRGTSGSMGTFCKDLLQNVINCLTINDRVFRGPSSADAIGEVDGISVSSYRSSSFQESKFHWLSLYNGYLEDEKFTGIYLSEIIGGIGFPIISVPHEFVRILKSSIHNNSIRIFTPSIIRTYLNRNRARWEDKISRKKVLQLFDYILRDKEFDELVGFKMIPLADGKFGTLTKSKNSYVYIGPDDKTTNHQSDEQNIFKDQLDKFIDKTIEYGLYQRLYDNAKSGWNLNIKILDESVVADMIRLTLNSNVNRNFKSIIGNFIGKKSNNDNEEIQILDRREWIFQLWENFKYRDWDLTKFEELNLIPTSRSTLRKLKTSKKIFSNRTRNNNLSKSLITIFEKFGAVFVESEFDISDISKWNKISSYIIKPDDIIAVLNSFQTDSSYPKNLDHSLQNHEASALVEHLSNYLRLVVNRYNHIESNLIEVIKYLPIFTLVDHTSPISLLPGNKNWYLLPHDDEKSYGKIIYPSERGGFLSANSQNIYLLEDIIKISRLDTYNYWRKYVIPFLESQDPKDIDIVIDRLFDRLPNLIDESLKDALRKIAFVPAGTIKMSQKQQMPTTNIMLVKPTELFNPEEKAIIDLFFDDEPIFPAGKYGSPKKFLPNLKSLGTKSNLSPNDIVSRINVIVNRRKNYNVQEVFIHNKALKLFKYIDEKWETFNIDNTQNRLIRKTILEEEWIPTVDASEKITFSKPENCYCQKDKDLICLISPVIKSKVKNKQFLKFLRWDKYPEVEKVMKQLELCYTDKQTPKNLEEICIAIYKYMNEAFEARSSDNTSRREFEIMKKILNNKQWILCKEKFYPVEKVVFNLPPKFQSNDSLIVELPIEYTSKFKSLFKYMGVRDEIGVKDLITIIKNMVKEDKNKVFHANEIKSIIRILEQITKIQKDNKREGNNLEKLEGLLIPSTENILVDLHEIQFDDMEDRLDEDEKKNYKLAHHLVTLDIAKELELQTLAGKIYGLNYTGGDIDWDAYEQNELLTTRIKNIIEDYSINSLLKEFLQNADDAKATRFSIIVDERKIFHHNTSKKSLLSEEMEDWQGPAVWIYNDAEFSSKDFQALIKLGIGGKSNDDTKIGRFGIGFNCAFHVTDLPSFVSGKYIAFLDPNAKFLPALGYPPRRHRGTRFNFIEQEFKNYFPDQCYPYEAFDCDFSKEFKGTLFRLPLRTSKLAEQSEISNRVIQIKELLDTFQSNNEMLFLRNVESCSLHHMTDNNSQLIWEIKINMKDSCREIRKNVSDRSQIYQLDVETSTKDKKISEIWLLCTGGHYNIKQEFRDFSKNKRLKPRGGVAALLARSDEKSLDELKRPESFPNPPDEFTGEIYNYLSLSMASNLSVHLNGNFSLSSARSNILQSETNFLTSNDEDAKWNQYILYDVLPDLHIRLLEEIVKLEIIRHEKDKTNFSPHTLNNLWPITKNLTLGVYKNYGLHVIKKLGISERKVFWTEA